MENSAVIHCCLKTAPATRLSCGHLRGFLQWIWGRGLGAGISFVPGSVLGDTAENKVNLASALIKIPVLGGSKCEPSHTTSTHPAPHGCQR